MLTLLVACGGSDPTPLAPPDYTWTFGVYRRDGDLNFTAEGQQTDGPLEEVFDFGPSGAFDDQASKNDGVATGIVFASRDNESYSAYAQAPTSAIDSSDDMVGGLSVLTKTQKFRKDRDDATLELRITHAEVSAIDNNGLLLTSRECPWIDALQRHCSQTIRGFVQYTVTTWSQPDGAAPILWDERNGAARLQGFQGFWQAAITTKVNPGIGAIKPLWLGTDFVFLPDAGGDGTESQALLKLSKSGPLVVRLDISKIPLNTEFFVAQVLAADTFNHRGRESFIAAYLRDPQSSSGLSGASLRSTGLTALPLPAAGAPAPPRSAPAAAEPACAAPDAQAGTLQFSAAAYDMPEWAAATSPVLVTRTGGSHGRVSVRITSADLTARAGSDYTAVDGHIVFGDGDAEPRQVELAVLNDRIAEPEKSLRLTLSQPGGCATLGGITTAELTIQDDDRPLVLGNLTLGGTVSGLAGSGLVLDNNGVKQAIAANGPFVFDEPQPDLLAYRVTVATQPTQPTQLCSVTRGSGTFAGANVTDVAVDCATPPPVGGLDTGFGALGKAFSTLFAPADTSSSLALQGDGKLVVVGSKGGDFAVARFNADGSVDTGFGNAGLASAGFAGGIDDKARGVAVQPDGRIVVAGYTASSLGSSTRRFGLVRFNADGTLDTGFGNGGTVRTEIGAVSDEARSLAVQPDGRIVVAGLANSSTPAGVAALDFALVRYLANGTLDTSFGSGGKVTVSVGGGMSDPRRLLLLGDGRIVVSGGVGVAPNLNIINHTAVLRFAADGSLDAGFGSGGKVVHPLVGGADVLVQADGRLLVAGQVSAGLVDLEDLAVLRLNADGSVDNGFGSSGVASVGFGAASPDIGRAVALQADGRIVVAGHNSGAGLGRVDFVVARLNANGSLDTGFGNGGRLAVDFFAGDDLAHVLRVQPDGRIVVGGTARNGNLPGIGLVRINP